MLLTARLLIGVFDDVRDFFRTDVRLVEVENPVNCKSVVVCQMRQSLCSFAPV